MERRDVERRDVENLDMERRDVERPDVERPDMERPDMERPDVERPDVERPDMDRPDMELLVTCYHDTIIPRCETAHLSGAASARHNEKNSGWALPDSCSQTLKRQKT